MKKILIYIFGFVLICFAIPIIFSKKPEITSLNENIIDQAETQTTNESKYANVNLLHTETGEVETITMNEYLYGVVSAEMPADYETEALKTQAIVARTYTAYKMFKGSKHENADICDSASCCQAWISKENRLAKWNAETSQSNWDKIVSAVDSTENLIITYDEEPINAFFHSNSGGTTEIVSNVWGGTDYPYLQSVATSGEEGYSQYSSEVVLTKDELIQKIKEAYPEAEIDFNLENQIQILEYTDSGRVRTIQFGNISISGVEARTIFGLKSAKFSVEVGENVSFKVVGYGHGVGLSQTGADAMAKTGANYEQIINHYYSNVKIENIWINFYN